MDLTVLEEYDRRKYGSVQLIFYANRTDLAEDDDVGSDEADVDGAGDDADALL